MNLDRFKQVIASNAPRIAMCGAGLGYIGTTFLAIRGTKKAVRIIDEIKKEKNPSKKEIIKAIWKCYIPAASLGTASTIILCYAGASYEKRNKATLAAYAISERAFKEFREAVEEKLDGDQLKAVYERVGEKHISENPVPEEIKKSVDTGPDGKSWFLEPIGVHGFRSTKDEVKNIIAELNMRMSTDPLSGYISVEEYCDALGVTSPRLSNKFGWGIGDGFLNIFIGKGELEDGTPCYTIVHRVPPKWHNDY